MELSARSLDRALTYAVPAALEGAVGVGSYVRAPLGKQIVSGFVVGLTDHPPPQVAIRPLLGKLVDDDPLTPSQVELARWLAARYGCTLAEALRCFLPPGITRRVERTVRLTEAGRDAAAERAVAAAPNQKAVLDALRETDGLNAWRLGTALGGGRDGAAKAAAAVKALERKGLAVEQRALKRPPAGPRTQQAARLADVDRDWLELIEELGARAPRQAEVIATLLEAGADPVLVSDLHRDAVGALQRAGLVEVFARRIERAPETCDLGNAAAEALTLNPAQQRVVTAVQAALARGETAEFLIHGVTGSGKTEVYLHSIATALNAGRGALVLVPEIALTPQAVGRFRARFGDRLALLHSALGPGERFDEWERIRRGAADIVVGARSAIFAPCRNVGVIVVDEEHERAYKQESEPRYLARVVAQERARRERAVLILGSATPAVETYHAASAPDDTLALVELPERVDNRPLPPVQIVDLRSEPLDAQGGVFSEALLACLTECMAAGEQAILFLNRRGFSTFVMCRECGHSLHCPDCAVALTYHHRTRRLRCHHCDHDRAVPDKCENCEGFDVGFHGLGTERVADQVTRVVEGAVVARMDRDTTTRRGALGGILSRFAAGEANVLVGTQMIAKGHDFPNVTLVGVLNADTGLNRPDFRAAEHTFQLLTQVSGRAGRAAKPGRVIVQTYNPDHYAVLAAARHDYHAFYERELASRRANRYPPFASLIKLGFADENEDRALDVARRAAVVLQERGIAHKEGDLHFLGPAEAPLHKLRGRYRYHMLIKGPDADAVRDAAEAVLKSLGDTGDTTVTMDIDPMDMM